MKIRIPEPCHEDWNKMTPKEQGRHCASCDKTVLDFTGMSDKQIMQQLQQNTSTCGRFSNYQLNRDLVLHQTPPKYYGFWKLAACAVLSVNIFDGMANHAPRNFVERHDVPRFEQSDSIPLPFNGRIKFKINAAPEHLDSLMQVHFQLSSFQMVFDEITENQIYEFHVPDSVLWEKIEILMVARDSVSTKIELTKKEWLEQYQLIDKELLIEFVDFWTIRKTELLLVCSYPEYIFEPISIYTVVNGNFILGGFAPEWVDHTDAFLSPPTPLHPPVFITSPEPIVEEDQDDEIGIFLREPSPPEPKRNPWNALYYLVLAGIVGFFTRWAYKKRHRLFESDETPLE